MRFGPVVEGVVCPMKIGLVLDILGAISQLLGKAVCYKDSHREDKLLGPLRSFGLIHMMCASPKYFLLETIALQEVMLGQVLFGNSQVLFTIM